MKYPCRYLWHRMNIVDGDRIKCTRCDCYAPTCPERLNDIKTYGFILD